MLAKGQLNCGGSKTVFGHWREAGVGGGRIETEFTELCKIGAGVAEPRDGKPTGVPVLSVFASVLSVFLGSGKGSPERGVKNMKHPTTIHRRIGRYGATRRRTLDIQSGSVWEGDFPGLFWVKNTFCNGFYRFLTVFNGLRRKKYFLRG
jgi:hypothetical protein